MDAILQEERKPGAVSEFQICSLNGNDVVPLESPRRFQGTLIVVKDSRPVLKDNRYIFVAGRQAKPYYVSVHIADMAFEEFNFGYGCDAHFEFSIEGCGRFSKDKGKVRVTELPDDAKTQFPDLPKYDAGVVKPILEGWRVQHPEITDLVVE